MKNNPITKYVVGFIFSILLTLSSYFAVTNQLFTKGILTIVILVFAFAQLVVQMVFFLHLAGESKPRWKLIFFFSTISIILVVVLASIWIMDNLNYHMTPQSMNNYMLHEEGFTK